MTTRFLGGLGPLLLGAGLAGSADLPAHSGVYGGLMGGLAHGDSTIQEDRSVGDEALLQRSHVSGRSLSGGFFVGGGWAGPTKSLRRLYMGFEGTVAFQNISVTSTLQPTGFINEMVSLTLRQTLGFYGRLGFFPIPNVLVYGKVGALWGRWAFRSLDRSDPEALSLQSDSTYRPGVSGGVGIEFALGNPRVDTGESARWAFGLDYTYSGFRRINRENKTIGTYRVAPRFGVIAVRIRRTF